MPRNRMRPMKTPTSLYQKSLKSVSIIIPQNPTRPIQVRTRDLIKREFVNPDPPWFVGHRRFTAPSYGASVLEHRAIPADQVRGTLPERIVYKFLGSRLHLTRGIDFDFQSSQLGGRLELGGLVVDFVLYTLKCVIQVQGPTHGEYIRVRKDQEQAMILAEMGYSVIDLDMDLIYNQPRFENEMRRLFNLVNGGGSGASYNLSREDEQEAFQEVSTMGIAEQILNELLLCSDIIRSLA